MPESSTATAIAKTRTRKPRLDKVCADADELAREAAEEAGDGIGEHLSVEAEDERVVTHYFECTLPGYRGWRWAVVLSRVPRARVATVSETALLPGPDALRAPAWVPWADRLEAGEVGTGEVLPTDEDDDRLMPAYTYSEDDAVEDIAYELGVGRERVMNRFGRTEAAQRWYEGDRGPTAPIAEAAPASARCGTCGFFLPLAGSMRSAFGACANLYSSEDARVVSADHGCGAHSQIAEFVDTTPQGVVQSETVYDDEGSEVL
ncbi:DUF3027 domain-containing protein [Glycomyces buryatensis]|uniref:DUF3027 domain-containing protein n=1 Tax=Glycomyces buryatensis TaxID=2570927 RepID=UPI001B3C149E|nr:DUF3027 domain-containing protein [Glycomyces buryatensis]